MQISEHVYVMHIDDGESLIPAAATTTSLATPTMR